jgi:putative transposase
MLNIKRLRFPLDIILVCIRWYAAYPLSYRHFEEMMQERGVFVDHSSINRWAIRFLPLLEKVFRRKYKCPVGGSWRMDETYIKINGAWKYLYRAVDKEGKTIDFLLRAKRDKTAAMRFFEQAMQDNGIPEKVTMDKSGANKAAIDQIIEDQNLSILVRQVKYLNNIVEQDHRAVKRITKPMLGFKSFRSARDVLAGIELMHMIRKGQMMMEGCDRMSFADQFYALAGHLAGQMRTA